MNKFLSALSLMALLAVPSMYARTRAEAEKPIAVLNTNAFAQQGSANRFHIVVGGTPGEYIDVDCGFGTVEVELKPAVIQDGVITASYITCSVSSAGTVKIYGNASDIDYFEAEGCYLRSADISQLKNLTVLDLEHNELEGLDLSGLNKLQAIYVNDNPFSQGSPLKIGANKPDLQILEMGTSGWLDQSFNLSDYPSMISFDAFGCETLYNLDPSGCPNLVRLTADATPLSTVDVSKNSKLQILNVSDTRITSIDVTQNPLLQQLYVGHQSHLNNNYHFKSLDVTKNPYLIYLFCGGNEIKELDLSHNPELIDLKAPHNLLEKIDLSNNKKLLSVSLSYNYIGYADLPFDPGTWIEYNYKQNPIPVKRSYKVGTPIDLSARMLRAGTITTARLMKKNEGDFTNPIEVDAALYSYSNGVITVNEAMPDSLCITYSNDRFPDETISTSYFMVKSDADFGKDNCAVSFVPTGKAGTPLSFKLRIASATVTPSMSVDFGDGTPVAIASSELGADGYYNITGTCAGDTVRVMLPEEVDATGLQIANLPLSSLNIADAPLLSDLSLIGTTLPALDLIKHRCIETLVLNGNNFGAFSLKAMNNNFAKTMLLNLDISNNKISTLEFDGFEGIRNINISNNALTELNLATANDASVINISGNKLSAISLAKCDALEEIDLSNNQISEITMPEIPVLKSMNIANNNMTINNLPAPSYFSGNYTYAPQLNIVAPVKGPGADFSQQVRALNGALTEFKWHTTSGEALVLGTDYSINNGITTFLAPSVGKEVYCKITHPAFPQFNSAPLTSTSMQVAAPPTDVIATFTTTGSDTANLSLAATGNNSSVFIDWKGDNSYLTMYELGATYRSFTAKTTPGAKVRILTYADADPLSVFSITGAGLEDVDLSQLSKASTINLGNAKAANIKLPTETANLAELFLQGNKLTKIDLSKYPKLYYLSLNNNAFEGEFDFSKMPNLQLASMTGNKLTSVILNNSMLWALDLSGNLLTEVDLSNVMGIEQLGLSNNRLTKLNILRHRNIKQLNIDRNYFRFSTLPPTRLVSISYVYSNQAPIEIPTGSNCIDLSAENTAGGQSTQFRWFLDQVTQDENGNYVGEELVAGDEYTLANGVTTFTYPFENVIGLLTNPAFPNLALFTTKTTVTDVNEVENNADFAVTISGNAIYAKCSEGCNVKVYNTAGSCVASVEAEAGTTHLGNFPTGVYIVKATDKTIKVAVK